MKNSEKLISCKSWKEWEIEGKQYKKDHPFLSWFAENIHLPLVRAWIWIESRPREIKWWFQRANRGWSDCDAWELFEYNARVMSEALLYLSENLNGTPTGLSLKTWRKQLKEASDLFKQIYTDLPMYNPKVLKKITKIMERDYYSWWD